MSEVVIRSTENGPNLLMVEGKVVQAWCRCGGSTLMPFCDGTHTRRTGSRRKRTKSRSARETDEKDVVRLSGQRLSYTRIPTAEVDEADADPVCFNRMRETCGFLANNKKTVFGTFLLDTCNPQSRGCQLRRAESTC